MSGRGKGLVWLGLLSVGLALLSRTAILHTIASDLDRPEFEAEGEPFESDPDLLDTVALAGPRISPLHSCKVKHAEDSWVGNHPEEVQQTFASYRSSRPNRPTPERTTLYLQPWGDLDEAQSRIVSLTGEMLGRFYGVPVRFLERVDLKTIPRDEWVMPPQGNEERLMTSYLLGELERARPPDAVAVLALTNADLSRVGRGSWAFGQATLTGGAGVCSLRRQGDPHRDFTRCLLRTLKTAVHETGHMLSIRHCAEYECAMNGSSDREEADMRPLWFCHEDEMKVWLACRLDPSARYQRLAEFSEANGLDGPAQFWRKSQAAVEARTLVAPVGQRGVPGLRPNLRE